MTTIQLPETRICGNSSGIGCYNCYAYGGGGPCANCMSENIPTILVTYEEFRDNSTWHQGVQPPTTYQQYVKYCNVENVHNTHDKYIVFIQPKPWGEWRKHNISRVI